ncbi:hypothetical protein ASPBRDRAFT_604840 [Aspergillus brasiliensis CBS 101740]|uniref:Uncharacterized protein n=1 Tax=Aspergillus brasiliensis (strain CBS 101740 / IMI 381727 / IBT 21946) TaxID=767769 RepID=A0A1L9UHT3_ASPBC|nr:hypothetical protein ASPBRDRAFT_604840 [Aspergillus brasiliensis CBS 101740]
MRYELPLVCIFGGVCLRERVCIILFVLLVLGLYCVLLCGECRLGLGDWGGSRGVDRGRIRLMDIQSTDHS